MFFRARFELGDVQQKLFDVFAMAIVPFREPFRTRAGVLAVVVSGGSSAVRVGAAETASDWEASSGSSVSSRAVGLRRRSVAGLAFLLVHAEGLDEELQLGAARGPRRGRPEQP